MLHNLSQYEMQLSTMSVKQFLDKKYGKSYMQRNLQWDKRTAYSNYILHLLRGGVPVDFYVIGKSNSLLDGQHRHHAIDDFVNNRIAVRFTEEDGTVKNYRFGPQQEGDTSQYLYFTEQQREKFLGIELRVNVVSSDDHDVLHDIYTGLNTASKNMNKIDLLYAVHSDSAYIRRMDELFCAKVQPKDPMAERVINFFMHMNLFTRSPNITTKTAELEKVSTVQCVKKREFFELYFIVRAFQKLNEKIGAVLDLNDEKAVVSKVFQSDKYRDILKTEFSLNSARTEHEADVDFIEYCELVREMHLHMPVEAKHTQSFRFHGTSTSSYHKRLFTVLVSLMYCAKNSSQSSVYGLPPHFGPVWKERFGHISKEVRIDPDKFPKNSTDDRTKIVRTILYVQQHFDAALNNMKLKSSDTVGK